eukprot:287337-Chlamydomonas_euryale.AAC.6
MLTPGGSRRSLAAPGDGVVGSIASRSSDASVPDDSGSGPAPTPTPRHPVSGGGGADVMMPAATRSAALSISAVRDTSPLCRGTPPPACGGTPPPPPPPSGACSFARVARKESMRSRPRVNESSARIDPKPGNTAERMTALVPPPPPLTAKAAAVMLPSPPPLVIPVVSLERFSRAVLPASSPLPPPPPPPVPLVRLVPLPVPRSLECSRGGGDDAPPMEPSQVVTQRGALPPVKLGLQSSRLSSQLLLGAYTHAVGAQRQVHVLSGEGRGADVRTCGA